MTAAAAALGITRAMLSCILNGARYQCRHGCALIARTSLDHWLALQGDYDLWQAQRKFKARIKRIAVSGLPKLANG